MLYEPIILSLFLMLAFFFYISMTRLGLRITRKGEGEQMDQCDEDKHIVRHVMDEFDMLVGEFENVLKRAESNRKVPQEHKWAPYWEAKKAR